MGLMLVDVIAVNSSELLENVFLMLPPHFLLITAFLHAAVNFALDIFLHIRRHISMVFELTHSIHIVFFLIELEGVKAMLLLLLIVNVSRCLLLLQLLLCPLKLVIDGLEHVPLFLLLSFLLFFGVHLKKFIRDEQQLSKIIIFSFQLLNDELLVVQFLFSDVAIIFY
jgi:hypothetical protein